MSRYINNTKLINNLKLNFWNKIKLIKLSNILIQRKKRNIRKFYLAYFGWNKF